MKSALTTAQPAAHQFQAVNENFDNTCNGMIYHIFSNVKEANESYNPKHLMARSEERRVAATSKVSKGGDTLGMPSIINLQESGLR